MSADVPFKYTLDNGRLSFQQRQFYEDNGFLLVKNLVDNSILDECIQRFKDICNGKIDKGHMTLMKDISLSKTDAKGEYLYNKIQDIVWDEVFSKYFTSPQMLDYVECFTGPDIVAMHTMLINKPPDLGKLTSAHPLHQDLHYFSFRPANRIVAAWTALEKITVDNGCLFVIPGSHKGELHQHDYPNWKNGVNKAYHGVKGYDDHANVKLLMEKGETVFFHPLLIHGSGPNLTKGMMTCHFLTGLRALIFLLQGFRKAISCHYSTSDFYHIDVKGTLQENVAHELEEMARRRGMNLDFKQIWDLRLRTVRGKPPSHL